MSKAIKSKTGTAAKAAKRVTGLARARGDDGRQETFEPTNEQRSMVSHLAAGGATQEIVRQFITWPDGKPVSEVTLRKHFADELAYGSGIATAKVAGALFKSAMGGNLGAQIFWLKTRGRWKETPQTHELTGPDGEPLPAAASQVTVYLPQKDPHPGASA